jgi:polysaccharide pyruvyl transferase WcaK-like protein
MRIALLNHIGGGNLGDDATVDAVIQNIRTRWPQAEICAITMNPADTEKRHGVAAYPVRAQTWDVASGPPKHESSLKTALKMSVIRWKPLVRLLKGVKSIAIQPPLIILRELRFLTGSVRIIRRIDLLVVCGGGQFTERDGPWAFPYTLLKWVAMAKAIKVKCIILNVGAGPLKRPLSKVLSRWTLGAAEYVSFRDEQSLALARQIGFKGEARTVSDNVYSFQCPRLQAVSFKTIGRPVVGFAPVPYREPRMHPAECDRCAYDKYLAKSAEVAYRLIKSSNSVVLFGTDIGVDPLANRDLLEVLHKYSDIAMPQYDMAETIPHLLATMSAMDYVVTCRFHGVVFAHLLNKPVLAIAHHRKVTDLMESLGLSKYCFDIETFDSVQVVDAFESLTRNVDEIKRNMALSLAVQRTRLAAQFDELFPASTTNSESWNRQPSNCQERAVAHQLRL